MDFSTIKIPFLPKHENHVKLLPDRAIKQNLISVTYFHEEAICNEDRVLILGFSGFSVQVEQGQKQTG